MNTAEQNYRLLQEIDANRSFMLMAYQQNPKLLEHAEVRIKQMFEEEPLRQIEERTGFSAIFNSQSFTQQHGAQPLSCAGKDLAVSILNPQKGASLIELIMFIVIVSSALAGVLLVMNTTTKGSADPLIRKQAIAAAYSLLEEVELQDFIAASGVATAGQVTQANRASGYHIVNEYNNFATSGIFSVADAASASVILPNYNAMIAVSGVALGSIAAGSAVQIDVTVTATNGETITATGYRTAY